MANVIIKTTIQYKAYPYINHKQPPICLTTGPNKSFVDPIWLEWINVMNNHTGCLNVTDFYLGMFSARWSHLCLHYEITNASYHTIPVYTC